MPFHLERDGSFSAFGHYPEKSVLANSPPCNRNSRGSDEAAFIGKQFELERRGCILVVAYSTSLVEIGTTSGRYCRQSVAMPCCASSGVIAPEQTCLCSQFSILSLTNELYFPVWGSGQRFLGLDPSPPISREMR
jgi:hypothetical protein